MSNNYAILNSSNHSKSSLSNSLTPCTNIDQHYQSKYINICPLHTNILEQLKNIGIVIKDNVITHLTDNTGGFLDVGKLNGVSLSLRFILDSGNLFVTIHSAYKNITHTNRLIVSAFDILSAMVYLERFIEEVVILNTPIDTFLLNNSSYFTICNKTYKIIKTERDIVIDKINGDTELILHRSIKISSIEQLYNIVTAFTPLADEIKCYTLAVQVSEYLHKKMVYTPVLQSVSREYLDKIIKENGAWYPFKLLSRDAIYTFTSQSKLVATVYANNRRFILYEKGFNPANIKDFDDKLTILEKIDRYIDFPST